MKRILFVDDEQPILDGLRAMLRPKRDRWQTEFVNGGKAALEVLARAPFDVIVTDMRMPEMDGATLLRHVQARHPEVVRIVLSGHAEVEAALRTVPVAHQFLLKPCDPDVLESVVQRACDLQSLVNDEAMRKFVGGVQSLPPLPQIYVRLTALLENERAGFREISTVIEQDPALCAKVLQLVNSSFIGLGRSISDVESAIRYLGINLLKNLTLAVQVFHLRTLSEEQRLQLHRLQRHGLLVGAIARRIAAGDARRADDAFMAGILHDIGKLVLLDHETQVYDLVRRKSRLARRAEVELEREVLGVSHAEVGGFLLGIWGLPYPIVQAAADHHSPERVHAPAMDVHLAVYVANHLAHELECALGTDESVRLPLDEGYLSAAGVLDRLGEWRELAQAQLGESRGEHWTDPGGEAAA